MKDRLPELPSAFLRLAITDLRSIIDNPAYEIYMNSWHEPALNSKYGKCAVCLAGAVMANTLDVPIQKAVAPYEDKYFTPHDSKRLDALDSFRSGRISDGLIRLNLDLPSSLPSSLPISKYDPDAPEVFIGEMEDLVVSFEAVNY